MSLHNRSRVIYSEEGHYCSALPFTSVRSPDGNRSISGFRQHALITASYLKQAKTISQQKQTLIPFSYLKLLQICNFYKQSDTIPGVNSFLSSQNITCRYNSYSIISPNNKNNSHFSLPHNVGCHHVLHILQERDQKHESLQLSKGI